MADNDGRFAKLLALAGVKSKDDAAGVFSAQATLANQHAVDSQMAHAHRMGKVQDAFWKCRYGDDYQQPEEDDMPSNFINCTINSDQAIRNLAAILGEGDAKDGQQPGVPSQPIEPTPKPIRWLWRALLLLSAVLLGAALIWITLQLFGGGEPIELIAIPFEPGET